MLSKEELQHIRSALHEGDEHLPFIFNALSDTGRFRIFKLLLHRKDLCVTEIANVFGISVPAASQQLRMMEMSGVVKRERQGQMICYGIKHNDPIIKTISKMVDISPKAPLR